MLVLAQESLRIGLVDIPVGLYPSDRIVLNQDGENEHGGQYSRGDVEVFFHGSKKERPARRSVG